LLLLLLLLLLWRHRRRRCRFVTGRRGFLLPLGILLRLVGSSGGLGSRGSFGGLLWHHRQAKCFLPAKKSWVPIRANGLSHFIRVPHPLKSVKVELALKGLVLGLLEVGRHDLFHEPLQVVDLEGRPVVYPRNNVGIDTLSLDGLEHLVEFPRKGQLGTREIGIPGEARKGEGTYVHPGLPSLDFAVVVVAAAAATVGVIVRRPRFGWQDDVDGGSIENMVSSAGARIHYPVVLRLLVVRLFSLHLAQNVWRLCTEMCPMAGVMQRRCNK